MANNYFQFKQFTVQQQHCAMKVCTDACVFAAIAANRIAAEKIPVDNILDIGTGTGLLGLMLAQKTTAVIDAIETDEAAWATATQNFAHSPWAHRLNALHVNAINFTSAKKYDCIISNPPFFEGDLPSADEKRNAAMHSSELNFAMLLSVIKKHLSSNGFFCVLLPFHRMEYFETLAAKENYFCFAKTMIKQTVQHSFFRSVLFFSGKPAATAVDTLTIKNEQGMYTNDFILLLKDYYLYL